MRDLPKVTQLDGSTSSRTTRGPVLTVPTLGPPFRAHPPHSNTSGRCPVCGCCLLCQPPAAWLLAPPYLSPSPSQQRGCSGDLWLLSGLGLSPCRPFSCTHRLTADCLHPVQQGGLGDGLSPSSCLPDLFCFLPHLLRWLSGGPVGPFSVPALTLRPGPGTSPGEALPPLPGSPPQPPAISAASTALFSAFGSVSSDSAPSW